MVANHALLFSDCALRDSGYGLLPDYQMLVLDEAHTLERVAEEHFGLDIGMGRVLSLLNSLYHPRRRRGLLAAMGANPLIDQVQQARHAAEEFFSRVRQWYQQNEHDTHGRCHPYIVEEGLSTELKGLIKLLRRP